MTIEPGKAQQSFSSFLMVTKCEFRLILLLSFCPRKENVVNIVGKATSGIENGKKKTKTKTNPKFDAL